MDLDIDTPIEYTNKDYNILTKNAEFLINLAIKANKEGNNNYYLNFINKLFHVRFYHIIFYT